MCRKVVLTTLVFCLQGPFLQLPHMCHMLPMEYGALKGLSGCVLSEGLRILSLHLCEFSAPGCPGILNSYSVVVFGLHDHCGTFHPSIEFFSQMDALSFLIGGSSFGLLLVQYHLKVLDCPLSIKI